MSFKVTWFLPKVSVNFPHASLDQPGHSSTYFKAAAFISYHTPWMKPRPFTSRCNQKRWVLEDLKVDGTIQTSHNIRNQTNPQKDVFKEKYIIYIYKTHFLPKLLSSNPPQKKKKKKLKPLWFFGFLGLEVPEVPSKLHVDRILHQSLKPYRKPKG